MRVAIAAGARGRRARAAVKEMASGRVRLLEGRRQGGVAVRLLGAMVRVMA